MTDFDFSVIQRSLPYLFATGMVFTLQLTAIATVGGLVIGTLIAMMRLSSVPFLPKAAALYVNVVRALPLVLVIFLFYFLSPFVLQWILKSSRPVQMGAYVSAVVTFTLFEAAYFSEIIRAGIQSIPKGQIAAGQALGLRYWQMMASVVLPQAFRNMLPVIFTQTIVLFQDTSLVYVLSLTDFLGAASKVAQREGRLTELYLFAAAVYFAFSFSASLLATRLQERLATPR
ncbi:MAG: ABC transporter permease subunit [Comamonadaceae bacterium]|nr:MAG: ABC transporter permease subunit [Comamonadaceae bacterium]